MAGFLGADTDQLKAHAARVRSGGEQLSELSVLLRSCAIAMTWRGPDADVFRERARVQMDHAAKAAVSLDTLSRTLLEQASQQDLASRPGDQPSSASGSEQLMAPAAPTDPHTADGTGSGSSPAIPVPDAPPAGRGP
jgi:hypothetical protein